MGVNPNEGTQDGDGAPKRQQKARKAEKGECRSRQQERASLRRFEGSLDAEEEDEEDA